MADDKLIFDAGDLIYADCDPEGESDE